MKRIFLLMMIVVLSSMIAMAKEDEYIVKNGESIYLIAKNLGVSMDKLIEANPILKETIYTGMILKVPAKDVAVTDSVEIAEEVAKPVIENMVESIPESKESEVTTSVSNDKQVVKVEASKENKSIQKEQDKKPEYCYLGATYNADFDYMDCGMYGIKIDRVTLNGWNVNMRILTNWGIKGTGFTEQNVNWVLGTNYCLGVSENFLFFFPILFNAAMYDKVVKMEPELETKVALGVGLSSEPSMMLRFGRVALTAGVDVNWFTHLKKINTGLVVGLMFKLY